ncbi:hypothetical protein PHYBLDRAFT_138970 [Phycomyces blakesleeanus NRRL 1555(-)]|uniref:Uncharacterized protein n=1 Tax=Phycomyces blakesleeanus (strain ATCC 8743b / DSM 1359 / FGSC 10004 / NBRC 33097 / NRRL 1555) TaxID=763407 RepID=A0A163BGD8_PHYB8|nr:hypothetical protein PHYBLDRAFT_138970 [Phycomyces blakesleeanus NRRL 1555(-)]OAD81421.1 hypothetical protein PHYBLDRAFT_138970 [Phycomyces blakesleeanus NRRL 1555(-)]|eukprot:XP_018299461.1 hypothetical protein PHYBLDRAFT_138970 [Phycomyces blakesleeanus NRRL 1555(-)]
MNPALRPRNILTGHSISAVSTLIDPMSKRYLDNGFSTITIPPLPLLLNIFTKQCSCSWIAASHRKRVYGHPIVNLSTRRSNNSKM